MYKLHNNLYNSNAMHKTIHKLLLDVLINDRFDNLILINYSTIWLTLLVVISSFNYFVDFPNFLGGFFDKQFFPWLKGSVAFDYMETFGRVVFFQERFFLHCRISRWLDCGENRNYVKGSNPWGKNLLPLKPNFKLLISSSADFIQLQSSFFPSYFSSENLLQVG